MFSGYELSSAVTTEPTTMTESPTTLMVAVATITTTTAL